MTAEVDPRLARRRRQIQEASARRRLRWTITVLLLSVMAGLVVALFQSSWFSVDSIVVEGESRAPVVAMLKDAGIQSGVSIVSVRAGKAEERLREDPWIAEAQVRVVWPRSVEVIVVEYLPVARVSAGDSWIVSSGQGGVLTAADNLVEPLIRIDVGSVSPGAILTDVHVLGALEFVRTLPAELKIDLVVDKSGSDLVATVAGHLVELGSPSDMAEKAVTLAVLLEEGLTDGAAINLVSPLRPAVGNPQPLVEGSQEVTY
ncbi:MAG: FtsQ-type POTRA domain-containing protein [Actinomycetota bacterium]|nr:FtsQ-type POTRA domain-containing protein [Actinomycetota bacterium]